MNRVEKTVFLSYRRTNIPWAIAIFQNLTQHGYDVFFDFSGIASGDFERVILANIPARAHFIVLLTPSALERCGEPADWLRREIETALDCQRNIVPLMLEGFDFSAPVIATQLTGKLAVLTHYNGVRIPADYFDEGMERLRSRYLSVPLSAVLHPASPFAQQAAVEQKAAAEAAPAVAEKELTAQQWAEQGIATVDLDDQLRCFSEAIRLKPDYAEAFLNRGNARKAMGNLTKAIKDYNEAIRLRPEYSEAFNNRGTARYDQNDYKGAMKDYGEAIRLKPDNAFAFNNRGNAQKAKGKLDGAMRDYDEAIRLNPGYVNAFSNRGDARRFKGDLDGAIKDCNEAIRLKPDNPNAFYNRGLAREAKGDLRGADEDFRQVKRLEAAAGA